MRNRLLLIGAAMLAATGAAAAVGVTASLLATTEQLLGLPKLASAASATTMTAAFHL